MEILMKIIVILISVLVVLGVGFIGAIAVYLTEDETYESNKRNDEVHTREMDKR